MSSSNLPPRTQVRVIKQQDLKKAFKGIRPRRFAMWLNPQFREGESKMRIAMGQYGREENARQMEERRAAETTRRQKTVRIEDLK